MSVECFWVDYTGRAQTWLRRYAHDDLSDQDHLHEARIPFGEYEQGIEKSGDYHFFKSLNELKPNDDDERWPDKCEKCDYHFSDDERHQLFSEAIYRATDGREWIIRHLPAGAMYDAFWSPWKGPDGRSLTVVLPNPPSESGMHVWNIDGPAGGSDRRPWERTGEPPRITARPSILSPTYHGFLTRGVLSNSI